MIRTGTPCPTCNQPRSILSNGAAIHKRVKDGNTCLAAKPGLLAREQRLRNILGK